MNTKEAMMVAEFLHNGQTYGDGEDFTVHFTEVFRILLDEFLVIDESILVAAILHDTIEDTVANYKLIEKYAGRRVADLVFRVTNEVGINRKDRNIKTYQKIKDDDDAVRIKLADRIANVRHSIKGSNPKFIGMYKKEYGSFRYYLYREDQDAMIQKMWECLDNLLN